MIIPFLVFWVLLFVGRQELQIKGIAICIAVWLGLLIGFMAIGISPYIFVAAQAFMDVVLILFVFGGDIQIR
jgi:hypothetical protein